MLRKLCTIIILVFITTAFTVPAFAAGNDIYSKATGETGNLYVTITKPDSDQDFTFKKSYILCGKTDLEGIHVKLLRYNKNSGAYESFNNTDGVSSWTIGSSGIFMKEVQLETGLNDMRVVAYKTDAEGNVSGGYQITDFAITVSNESVKDKIIDSALKAMDIFKGWF
ncbi:MAG: hypothetical protein QHH06_04415 [Clostridiales bacterium]|jgi:hypothetical protein|nr:hypothetical protein [Eubacteriales bacterium]MDH7565711.1 hypothetical protein [Clostridiales bacterium]